MHRVPHRTVRRIPVRLGIALAWLVMAIPSPATADGLLERVGRGMLAGLQPPNFRVELAVGERPAGVTPHQVLQAVAARVEAQGGALHVRKATDDGRIVLEGFVENASHERLTQLLRDPSVSVNEVLDKQACARFRAWQASGTALPAGFQFRDMPTTYGGEPGERGIDLVAAVHDELVAYLRGKDEREGRWAVGPTRVGAGRYWTAYLLAPPSLTGKDVADAGVRESRVGAPYVTVTLTERGRQVFADLTTRVVRRRLAIVVDGEVTSAPVVQERIAGGRLQITLGQTTSPAGATDDKVAEAHALAASLRAPLPAPVAVESYTAIGAR